MFCLWLLVLGLVSCAPAQIENDPAAQDCENNGGKVEIRIENGEQIGYCVFPDGSECSQLDYEQGKCEYQVKNIEESNEPSTGLANPASVYCEEQGGTLDIRSDNEGNQFGMCVFSNGNECEEWAFFNGMCDPISGITITKPKEEAQFGMVYIEKAELKMTDNLLVFIKGELPDPCHQLYIQAEEPDAENNIQISANSWYQDNGLSCVQVLKPFEFNYRLSTSNLKDGTYTVFVNGEEIGAFNVSN
jgi:putative hemolysin